MNEVLAQSQAGTQAISINSFVMGWLYQLRHIMVDISMISLAMLQHIVSNTDFKMPELQPTTPYYEEIENLDAERVDPEEVIGWIREFGTMNFHAAG